MKNIRSITLSNQLFLYSTYVLATFPLLTFQLRSITLILWTIIGLYCAYQNRKLTHQSKPNKSLVVLIILVLPYLFLGLSLIYSSDLDYGLKRLVKLLPMLILPVIFYVNRERFKNIEINRICWVFTVSVILFVGYLMLRSFLNLDAFFADLTVEELKSNNLHTYESIEPEVVNKLKTRRFRNFILDVSNSHFTYQGIWIVFSVFFMAKAFFKLVKKRKTWTYVLPIGMGMLIIWLFLISSRMPILVMLAATFMTLLSLKILRTKVLAIVSVVSCVLLASSYFVFTPLQVRVNEILNYSFELPTSGNDIENYTSVNVRNGIYYCSWDTIKDNLVLGVGVGDAQQELNDCYANKIGAKIYTWTDYNTHNQYLFFWLSFGLLGVLSFIILLYTHFRSALYYKNALLFYFITVVSLICLTENILSRSDGVTFFALFSGLLLFNLKNEHDHS